jgi:hypothetical protein
MKQFLPVFLHQEFLMPLFLHPLKHQSILRHLYWLHRSQTLLPLGDPSRPRLLRLKGPGQPITVLEAKLANLPRPHDLDMIEII